MCLASVYTSSSAVAKRPRDALCLSVVSFNSTKRSAQSFIVSYVGYDISLRTIKCSFVAFGITLRLLVIHFVVVSRHQYTLRLPPTSVINSPWSVTANCIVPAAGMVRSTQ